MSILDFVLLGFFVVTLIIGLKKGFAKMITNGICIVAALAGSVVATMLLTNLVKGLDLYLNLYGSIASGFSQSFMTAQITSAEQLSQLLASSDAGIFSVLGGLAEQIFAGMQTAGAESLGAYLGGLLATAIVSFVIWLVSYLILKYVLLGVKKLICLLAKVPVIKSIDKIIGAVFSIAFGYIVVFGIVYSAFGIVCARFFPDFGAQVIAMVDSSTLFSYVHHTNFIGKFLCDMLQVDYSTLAPLF